MLILHSTKRPQLWHWPLIHMLSLAALGIDPSHPFFKDKFGLFGLNHSTAVARPRIGPADLPLYTPALDATLNALDALVEARVLRRRKNTTSSARERAVHQSSMLRAGSVARFRWQTVCRCHTRTPDPAGLQSRRALTAAALACGTDRTSIIASAVARQSRPCARWASTRATPPLFGCTPTLSSTSTPSTSSIRPTWWACCRGSSRAGCTRTLATRPR